MKLGIDFKAVAMKAAGHAGGVAVYSSLNNLPFMKKQKPLNKGLIAAAIGYLAVPIIASKLKLGGKKGGIIEHVGEGIGIVGLMQIANANENTAKFVPKIAGTDDDINGLGLITEDDVSGINDEVIYGLDEFGNEVAGYEQDPTLRGYEQNPVSGPDDIVSA